MEKKAKCLKCGYSLFFEKKANEIDCPKCTQTWIVVKEDEELFLEPKEHISNQQAI